MVSVCVWLTPRWQRGGREKKKKRRQLPWKAPAPSVSSSGPRRSWGPHHLLNLNTRRPTSACVRTSWPCHLGALLCPRASLCLTCVSTFSCPVPAGTAVSSALTAPCRSAGSSGLAHPPGTGAHGRHTASHLGEGAHDLCPVPKQPAVTLHPHQQAESCCKLDEAFFLLFHLKRALYSPRVEATVRFAVPSPKPDPFVVILRAEIFIQNISLP